MLRNSLFGQPILLRGLSLVGILSIGLISVVGSGGGSMGLPSDCPPGLDCSKVPPPVPNVSVEPPYVTALVGTPVTYTAEASNILGNLTYQWSRTFDGGASYVDIAGATGKTYSLASVSLGDDAATFAVAVRGTNATASALSHLVVSVVPGVVYGDGEFQVADWLVTPFADSNELSPAHTEERVATGGNPGAYWKMVFHIPHQSGSARVFYTSLVAKYEPQTQGAIKVIDYSEDSISFQANDSTSTESAMLLEQGGRRYIANIRDSLPSIPISWSAVQSSASLRAKDFNLIDGPACQTGESCPDFSALGPPMRFGYWRISFGLQDDSIAHGIDNWKVTVWRTSTP
jgi:hypothetical protein